MTPRVRAVGIFRRPFRSPERAAMGVQVNVRAVHRWGRLGNFIFVLEIFQSFSKRTRDVR